MSGGGGDRTLWSPGARRAEQLPVLGLILLIPGSSWVSGRSGRLWNLFVTWASDDHREWNLRSPLLLAIVCWVLVEIRCGTVCGLKWTSCWWNAPNCRIAFVTGKIHFRVNFECLTNIPLLLKLLKKDVTLERGKAAPVILWISTEPARRKSNEKHCVHVIEAKQMYLRKLFKCVMAETCYTHEWATSALGIALASMWKKKLKQDTNIK